MRVFISWSGPKSKAVALFLKEWLPSVIITLETPWVSSTDIPSGDNWSASIGTQLSQCNYGIVCVTKENQERTWLNFEAGAISKLVGGAAPLLIDFETTNELTAGPLSQLQVTMPTREGMGKLISDINAATSSPAVEAAIQKAFGRAFEEFEERLKEINADEEFQPSGDTPPRSTDSKVDEVLEIVRGIARDGQNNLNNLPRLPLPVTHPQYSPRTLMQIEQEIADGVTRASKAGLMGRTSVSQAIVRAETMRILPLMWPAFELNRERVRKAVGTAIQNIRQMPDYSEPHSGVSPEVIREFRSTYDNLAVEAVSDVMGDQNGIIPAQKFETRWDDDGTLIIRISPLAAGVAEDIANRFYASLLENNLPRVNTLVVDDETVD